MFFHFTKDNIFINEDNVGLGIIKRNKSYLNSYNKKNSKSYFLNEQSIFSFSEKEDGKMFVSKYNNGILVYDPKNKSLAEFEQLYGISLQGMTIKSMYVKNNTILICTTTGLFECDLNAPKLVPYTFTNVDFSNDCKFINHILEFTNGNIIIGTKDGIFNVDIAQKKLIKINLLSETAYFLFETKNHQLLTTSKNNSLAVYKIGKENLQLQGSFLKDFTVMSVWEDTVKKEFWFATREGIVHTNYNFDILHYLNSTNGLKSSGFYGILYDGIGHIWCSSNRGIATINLKDYSIYYYFTDSELSGLEYNGKSFLKSKSGLLYFGSETGFDIIDPNSFYKKSFTNLKIVVEDLLINNKKASNKILESIVENKIELTYNNNQVSLKVNLVNYENDFPIKLYYKVENLENDWLELEAGGWIRLIKLKPGKYTLLIKGDEKYCNSQKKIVIIITPAWYQTLLFKILVTFAIVSLLYILYTFRIRQLKKILQVRQKISSDLHDDIGSTLSTINMYSQVAQLQPNSPEHITNIQENTKEVLEKLDDIVWATNPKNDQVKNLLERIDNFARPLLKAKEIEFLFDYDIIINDIKINETTRQTLYLICKEAINNIAKYSNAKQCMVTLQLKNKTFTCIIKDDGIGFDTNKPTERNGLLNMQVRAEQLKGKFSLTSELNKGTTIKLQLPL
jgi:signal transduction histidine kinase